MAATVPLANAYPPSALSAIQLLVMALVVVGSLAAWLGSVYLAARPPRSERTLRRAAVSRPAHATSPDEGRPTGISSRGAGDAPDPSMRLRRQRLSAAGRHPGGLVRRS